MGRWVDSARRVLVGEPRGLWLLIRLARLREPPGDGERLRWRLEEGLESRWE